MNRQPSFLDEARFIIRNISSADIILPYRSLDLEPRDTLYIGRCITADKYTLEMIRQYVEVLAEVAPVHQEEAANEQFAGTTESNHNKIPDDIESSKDEMCCFLATWWDMYGSKFVRSSVLVPIAVTSWPGSIEDHLRETHQATIALARIIRRIEESPPRGWQVSRRRRSHTTEFKLERLCDGQS